MDPKNEKDILTAATYWKAHHPEANSIPDLKECKKKILMMTSYCTKYKGHEEVPDPYFGGPKGFEDVLDLLEDACEGLLNEILAKESRFSTVQS